MGQIYIPFSSSSCSAACMSFMFPFIYIYKLLRYTTALHHFFRSLLKDWYIARVINIITVLGYCPRVAMFSGTLCHGLFCLSMDLLVFKTTTRLYLSSLSTTVFLSCSSKTSRGSRLSARGYRRLVPEAPRAGRQRSRLGPRCSEDVQANGQIECSTTSSCLPFFWSCIPGTLTTWKDRRATDSRFAKTRCEWQ